MKSRRADGWPLRVGLLAASTVLALLAAEVALRLIGWDYSPMAIESEERLEDELPATDPDDRSHHLFQDRQFRYDPDLLWRPRESRSVFNRQGFRGPVLAATKPSGELRLFTLGDSNTLGWGRRRGAHWPGSLGELLARADDRWVTVNAGVWGYTVDQGVKRLEDALPWAPDVVLVSFGSNDAHPVFHTDAEYRRRLLGSSWPVLTEPRVGRVILAVWDRVVLPRWRRADRRPRQRTVRVPLDEFRRRHREIVRLGGEHGFRTVFLTRPYIGSSRDRRRWKASAPAYRRATLDVGAELGVPVFDVYNEFRGRPELFKDESHFTRDGHRIAAEWLFEQLQPALVQWFPRP